MLNHILDIMTGNLLSNPGGTASSYYEYMADTRMAAACSTPCFCINFRNCSGNLLITPSASSAVPNKHHVNYLIFMSVMCGFSCSYIAVKQSLLVG
jgi:hypothetical protein